MEALITIGGFIFIMLLLWAISHYVMMVRRPRRERPRVIAALELTERIGMADFDTNRRAVAERWHLIKTGVHETRTYRLEAYRPRLDAQYALLRTREEELRKEWTKRALPSIDIPIGL